ncbi:hypothetical protein FGO68_gene5162 [Halteria grandinella]|uniref:Uncharacterized protein n=1 Tax=Halteria grandinella TaxID=5974 RepID=A0A8J8NL13_HALGN|nr:hypothetical protein FGO68_gene5162 [Halteria grandinella]
MPQRFGTFTYSSSHILSSSVKFMLLPKNQCFLGRCQQLNDLHCSSLLQRGNTTLVTWQSHTLQVVWFAQVNFVPGGWASVKARLPCNWLCEALIQ